MIQNWNQVVIPEVPVFRSESPYLNQNAQGQYIHTFSPTMVNELRFGYHRGNRSSTNPRKNTNFTASQIGINGLKQGGPNGRELTQEEAGFPTLEISGYLGLGETGGSDVDATQTYQFVDNASLFRGKHALKMGVDIGRHLSDANTIN